VIPLPSLMTPLPEPPPFGFPSDVDPLALAPMTGSLPAFASGRGLSGSPVLGVPAAEVTICPAPAPFPGASLQSPSVAPASVAVPLAALANFPNGCFTASSKYPGRRYDPLCCLASAGKTEPS
jgi:hypothetical protein